MICSLERVTGSPAWTDRLASLLSQRNTSKVVCLRFSAVGLECHSEMGHAINGDDPGGGAFALKYRPSTKFGVVEDMYLCNCISLSFPL